MAVWRRWRYLERRVLGAGAYGSVEDVEIPGATAAVKKLHEALVDLGSHQQLDTRTASMQHLL